MFINAYARNVQKYCNDFRGMHSEAHEFLTIIIPVLIICLLYYHLIVIREQSVNFSYSQGAKYPPCIYVCY